MNNFFRITGSVLLGFVLLLSISYFLFVPVLKYPKLTGKYSVGNKLVHVVSNDVVFNIDVFYPSNATDRQLFLYRPEKIAALKDYLWRESYLKAILFSRALYNVSIFAQPDAMIAQGADIYPVIIYLPGIGSEDMHQFYTVELASYGYIVCAIEPPGDIAVTVFPDGKRIELSSVLAKANAAVDRKAIYEYRDQAHERWSNYIDIALQQLQELNDGQSSIFYQKLDLKNVGILGHSHGGAVALDYCQKSNRCKAGVDMDGWTKTYNSTQHFAMPFLFLLSQDGEMSEMQKLFENNQRSDFSKIIIKGADHGSFNDGVLVYHPYQKLFGNTIQNAERIRIEISQKLVSFFDRYLKS